MSKEIDSSWETSSSWYDKIVGSKGHYFHQHVIIPRVLKILEAAEKGNLLDLACGQGVLARHLPKGIHYVGVDASSSLIKAAQRYETKSAHQFFCHDLSRALQLPMRDFAYATCILALQNIADPLQLLKTAHHHLKPGALLVLVLNHPCFRIPRQSSWGVDEQKKLQYRRIERYMSFLKIPLQTRPSQDEASETTWSFHNPLSYYSALLKQAGFTIDLIEEWTSDKKSVGKTAAMENRSRQEFPLFLTLVAKKI